MQGGFATDITEYIKADSQGVAQHSGNGRATNPHMQRENKNRVQNDIGHGTDEHAQHGGHHGPFCTQELSHGIIDHKQHAAQQNDGYIRVGRCKGFGIST